MPYQDVFILAAVVAMFATFAATLAWTMTR